MSVILIVGGADTGRAPMAAALLARLLAEHAPGVAVGSAGVLGHDGDAAEIEARDTMLHMGLDITGHSARSVDEALVGEAALVVGIDSGTTRVLHGRFPEAVGKIASLGDLAVRRRDIPDPFRMQIGAWMSYARELDDLLRAALPRILELLPDAPAPAAPAPAPASEELPAENPPSEREAALERMLLLLRAAAELPEAIHWPGARALLDAEIGRACVPRGPTDLALAYAGLLRAALALTPPTPTPAQIAALRAALAPLDNTVAQDDLTRLSAQLAGWAQLA
ncbi:MAG TPA: protein tyrosine phosphatase [Roseiflexaceae bacterium]|nr:protein tyrosine phosphatase [Roseiflexaceae bacterium]